MAENGNGKLSFAERLAQSKKGAGAKAEQSADSPASSKFYFKASIDTFRFLLSNGVKISFKNHYFITDDVKIAEEVRANLCNRESGHITVKEISERDYDKSTILQTEADKPAE